MFGKPLSIRSCVGLWTWEFWLKQDVLSHYTEYLCFWVENCLYDVRDRAIYIFAISNLRIMERVSTYSPVPPPVSFFWAWKKRHPWKFLNFSAFAREKKVHVKKSKIASKSARENLVLPVKKIPKRHTWKPNECMWKKNLKRNPWKRKSAREKKLGRKSEILL